MSLRPELEFACATEEALADTEMPFLTPRRAVAAVAIIASLAAGAASCDTKPWDPDQYGQHRIVTNSGQGPEAPALQPLPPQTSESMPSQVRSFRL